MAFQRGRKKTGGRTKGPKSKRLVDQLKDYRFNYVKELADSLKALPPASKYLELKSLLPYMAPKLRERDVDLIDPAEAQAPAEKPISDDDLMKALQNGKPKEHASYSGSVAAGNPVVEVPRSAEANLPDVVGEQKED